MSDRTVPLIGIPACVRLHHERPVFSVVENAQPDAGTLTMVFTENPLLIRQWTVVDQEGKTTTVSLSDLQFGMPLDPKIFLFQDPSGGSRQ